MKRSLALLLAIVFILTLTSCGSDKKSLTTAAKKTEDPVKTYTPQGMCALCEEDATKTFLSYDTPVFLCDDCFSQAVICAGCGSESQNTSYRSKYLAYYCDECYGKGNKSVCDKCNKLVTKTILTTDENCGECEEYLCKECYKARSTCAKCKDSSKKTTHDDVYNLFFCKDCYNSGEPLACDGYCGTTNDLIKYSAGAIVCYFCKDCYNDATVCTRCSNSLKTASPREEAHGYFCDECYKNIKVCKKCGDASKKTNFINGIGEYFCSECDAENKICKNCSDASKKTEYDPMSEVYYCDDCFGDGEKESCDRCKKLFKKLTVVYGDDYEEYLCKDCVKISESCYKCKDTSKKAKYYKKYKVYCCDDCYTGKFSVCGLCSDVTDELLTLDMGGEDDLSLCEECYSREKLCYSCLSVFKTASYREGIYGYLCDDCFKLESVCVGCEDINQQTSYRIEYYMYYCDNCYGDGSYSLCDHCYKLFDYELYNYSEPDVEMSSDYFVCRECCKEMISH